MKVRARLVQVLFVAVSLLLCGRSVTAAETAVSTDKDDYLPGDAVHLTGRGFQSGEVVKLEFDETPAAHAQNTFTTIADASGGIDDSQFVIEEMDLGSAFTLVATGQSSALVARATFRDGPTLVFGTVTMNGRASTNAVSPTTTYSPVYVDVPLTASGADFTSVCVSLSVVGGTTSVTATPLSFGPWGSSGDPSLGGGACAAGSFFIPLIRASTTTVAQWVVSVTGTPSLQFTPSVAGGAVGPTSYSQIVSPNTQGNISYPLLPFAMAPGTPFSFPVNVQNGTGGTATNILAGVTWTSATGNAGAVCTPAAALGPISGGGTVQANLSCVALGNGTMRALGFATYVSQSGFLITINPTPSGLVTVSAGGAPSSTISPTPPSTWTASNSTFTVTSTSHGPAVSNVVTKLDTAASISRAGSSVSGLGFFGEGAHTISYYGVDAWGEMEPVNSVTFLLDRTAPIMSFTKNPAANGANWNRTNVVVSFSATDALSGVQSVTGPQNVTAEGASQTVTGFAFDRAGNGTSLSVLVNLDKTPPTITGSRAPAANSAGWSNIPVTVQFACADPLSGVVSCTQPVTFTSEGSNQSVTGSALDLAGNTSSVLFGGVSIDLTPPIVTATSNVLPGTWTSAPITVTFHCSDALSGVASCAGPQVVTSEGGSLSASGVGIDFAGNSAVGSVSGLMLDRTPPSITGAQSPVPNGFGWNNTDVHVSFVCSDVLSGVASCSAPVLLTAEGAQQAATGTATDIAGNSQQAVYGGTAVAVNIDKTPPTIALVGTPAPNAAGWNNTPVTVSSDCGDALSGVASCPAAQTVNTEGVETVSVTATDRAGNAASAGLVVSLDETPPLIHATTDRAPLPGGWYDNDVTVSFDCSDSLSGLATACPSPVTVSTEGAGQGVSKSVLDVAGNTAFGLAGGINVDKTPPTIGYTLDGAANAAGWYSHDVVLTFACDDAVSGVQSCSSPVVLSAEGTNPPVVGVAVDKAAHEAQVTVSGIRIDKTPPVLVGPGNVAPDLAGFDHPTAEATGPAGGEVGFAVTASDSMSGLAADVSCEQTSGALFPLGDTPVTCSVTDLAGNTGTLSFVATVVDTTPPVFDQMPHPSVGATSAAGAVVAYATPAAVDLVDGARPVSCAPGSGSLFPRGVSMVTCTSSDARGNTAQATFMVAVRDLEAPALTLPTDFAVEATSSAGAVVTYAATANDTIDGLTAVTCAPASGSTFSLGATRVSCSSADSSGNTANDAFTVTVQDTTAPAVVLDPQSLLPATTRLATLAVAGTASDGATGVASATFVVSNGGVPHSFGPFAVDAQGHVAGTVTLTEGSNQIILSAVDGAGNTSATAAHTVILDTLAPVVTIFSPADGDATATGTVQLSFGLADQTSTTVTVSGQTFSFPTGNVTSQSVTVSGLQPGLNPIVVSAQDAAGNVGTAQVRVLVDESAPALAIDIADGVSFGPLAGDQLPFTLTVGSIGATTITSSFGAAFTLPRGGGNVQGLAPLLPGPNALSFAAVDEVGNSAQLGRTVVYDPSPPTGAFASPSPGFVARGTIQISLDASDAITAVSSVSVAVDGQAPIAATHASGTTWIAAQSLNTATLADGTHGLAATITDSVGNHTVVTESFTIDNTAPTVAIAQPLAGATVTGVVQVRATAADATSGVASIAIKVNGTNAGSCTSSPCTVNVDTTAYPDGPLTISATGKDVAGNASPATQVSVTVSNSAPATFIVSPSTGQVLATTMTVAVKVVDPHFARVECFVDGASLGASTNPSFSTSVSLLGKYDGEVQVTCKAQDSSGNVGTQTVTPTVKNWVEHVLPHELNLKSKGNYVRMAVRNSDKKVLNAGILVPIAGKNLTFQIPGVSPVPVIASTPNGIADVDDDGDGEDDPADKEYRRVVLKVSRSTFIASVNAGVAVGSIDPKKPIVVKLYAGTHFIGSDTLNVK